MVHEPVSTEEVWLPSADWMDSLGAGEDAGVCCDPIDTPFGDGAFGAIGPLELIIDAGV